jgi:acetyltransferase-like isoleucine patch superfamily enzyme
MNKSFLVKLYLSFAGRYISFVLRFIGSINMPFMIYGYYNHCTKKFNYKTRISNTVKILNKKSADISDGVWIWHHTIMDATCGLKIGKGVQIGAWVGLFSHSSHNAIRLSGSKYFEQTADQRVGYIAEKIEIGDYTFIGASAIILPGVLLGKGCIVSAGSVVNKSFPDFSIISGNPAVLVGTTSKIDSYYLKKGNINDSYYLNDL